MLTNPMKARHLTEMASVVWQILAINIFPQVGHHSEPSSYVVYTLWRILSGQGSTYRSSSLATCGDARTKKEHAFLMGDSSRPSSSTRHGIKDHILPFKTMNYNSIYYKQNRWCMSWRRTRKVKPVMHPLLGQPQQLRWMKMIYTIYRGDTFK